MPAHDAAQPAVSDRWLLPLAVLVLGLLGLSIWPIWAGDWLPIHDAAQIEHQAAVIYDWNVYPSLRQDYERVPFPTPNWLGVHLITLLAPLGGVHIAFKLLLSLCMLGLLVACLDLMRTARHSPWLLLAVLPWLWHQEVFVGHLASVVGFPIFIGLLAVHLQFVRRPRAAAAGGLALLMALLAISNLQLWCLAALMLPLLALGFAWAPATLPAPAWPTRLRRGCLALLREVVVVLPSLALLVPWYRRAVAPEGGLSVLRAEWTLPMDAVKGLWLHMFDVFAPRGVVLDGVSDLVFNRPGDVITALWLIGMALWVSAAAAAARQKNALAAAPDHAHEASEGSVAEQQLRSAEGSWYLGWAFVWISLAYFCWPTHILRPIWIHGWSPRLVTLMALVGTLALPLRPTWPVRGVRGRTWFGLAALAVAALWMPLAALRSTVLVQQEFSYLREAMAAVPEGKSLLVLRPSPDSRWMQMRIFHPIGEYYAPLRGGSVPFGFIDPALQPVRPRDGRVRPSPPGDDHEAFTWHEHGRYYDFVAVFRDPFGAEPKYEAMLRSWPRIYQRGRWQVFHNAHPTAWTPQQALRTAKPASLDAQIGDAMLGLVGGWMGLSWTHEYEPDGVAARRFAVMLRKLDWQTTATTMGNAPPAVDPHDTRAGTGPAWVPAVGLPSAVTPALPLAPLLRNPTVRPAAEGQPQGAARPWVQQPSRNSGRRGMLH